MYSEKTRQIQNNHNNIKKTVPKFSNLQRPRIKINTGNSLVTNPNKSNIRKEMALEGKTEELSHKTGRKSYAEKAIVLGVYDDISDFLFYLRESNPFVTNKVVRDSLVEAFPEVFGGCSKYGQNLMKAIEAEEDWKNALNFNMNEVKNAVLQNLYQRAIKGVREEMDKDGRYYEIGMKDSDSIKFVQLLTELEKETTTIDTQEDDIPTFGFRK